MGFAVSKAASFRDIFQVIASRLTLADLAHLARTNKFAHALVQAEPLWHARLLADAPAWEPYVVRPAKELAPGSSWHVLYAELYRQYRNKRLSWDHTTVGGVVEVSADGREANFPGSYSTCRSAQRLRTGVHYLECAVWHASHYAGMGVLPATVELPEAGRGAWLNPAGALQWVFGSGLWGEAMHVHNTTQQLASGDSVGVELDLVRRQCTFYLRKANSEALVDVGSVSLSVIGSADPDAEWVFCACLGNGKAVITRAEK